MIADPFAEFMMHGIFFSQKSSMSNVNIMRESDFTKFMQLLQQNFHTNATLQSLKNIHVLTGETSR